MSTPRVVVEGLIKYHEGRQVLRGINLEFYAGEVVGIVGPGGHGKSVLLKHLPRLIIPDRGRVLIEGQDLAELSPGRLSRAREGFGYLFQNYALFDFMTVAENIAFPLRQEKRFSEDEIEAKVRQRLEEVGLSRAYSQFPRELSGGMKKRVGLARATINAPRLALYDDPSAGLDPVTSSRIFALIETMTRQSKDGTAIIISHDLDRMAPIVTRWLYLERGQILFDGNTKALTNKIRSEPDGAVGAFFVGTQVAKGGVW